MADGLERIPVNVEDVAEDAGAFLEKIEIVPLETNDSILFDTPSQVLYDKEADMYVLMSDMNVGDDFYFIPQGVDYYIYQMDTLRKEVFPVMYLDFGDAEIKEEELPGRASCKRVDNDKERLDIINENSKRMFFLRESTKHIVPMQKLLNEKYVYICMKKGQGMWHYIYNRTKGEGYLLQNEKPLRMNPVFGLDGNALLTVCQPVELPLLVDRRFMSPEQIAVMENLKEDDNPVILKYYLKP